MDVVMVLRVARVAMCFITIAVVLWLWMRRRVMRWQVLWLLLYLVNQTAFSTYILVANLTATLDASFARVWSIALDIHNLFAMLFYLIVVVNMRWSCTNGTWRDSRRRDDAGDIRDDLHQRHLNISTEWERQWVCGCRRREDQQRMENAGARAST